VVFADEPTGSLDSLTGEKVMDLMTGLARQQGATVVVVTHDARVASYADRVVMVRDGRVSADLGTGGGPRSAAAAPGQASARAVR
jgi:putative ABC transport system ATP-binding protein